MCFFVFSKKPSTFDYSVNVFKKILKKYLRDRNYVKNPLNIDKLPSLVNRDTIFRIIFLGFVY